MLEIQLRTPQGRKVASEYLSILPASVSLLRAWLVVHKCGSGPAAGALPGNLIRDSDSQIPLRPIESEIPGAGPIIRVSASPPGGALRTLCKVTRRMSPVWQVYRGKVTCSEPLS